MAKDDKKTDEQLAAEKDAADKAAAEKAAADAQAAAAERDAAAKRAAEDAAAKRHDFMVAPDQSVITHEGRLIDAGGEVKTSDFHAELRKSRACFDDLVARGAIVKG